MPKKRKTPPWTPEHVAMLGTTVDLAVARKLGRTRQDVSRERVERGIPPFRFHVFGENHKWTEEQLQLLGKVSDRELGRRIGRSGTMVRNYRRRLGLPAARDQELRRITLEELQAQLAEAGGAVALAAKWGVSRQRVYQIRQKLESESARDKQD